MFDAPQNVEPSVQERPTGVNLFAAWTDRRVLRRPATTAVKGLKTCDYCIDLRRVSIALSGCGDTCCQPVQEQEHCLGDDRHEYGEVRRTRIFFALYKLVFCACVISFCIWISLGVRLRSRSPIERWLRAAKTYIRVRTCFGFLVCFFCCVRS